MTSHSKKPTGGPAFPTENERQTGANSYHYEGMTLRDYFAAHAMQGMMVMPLPDAVDDAPKFLAKTAYGIADAMLKARQQ